MKSNMNKDYIFEKLKDFSDYFFENYKAYIVVFILILVSGFFIRFQLSREALSLFIAGLIALIGMLGAVIIFLFSSKKNGNAKNLYKDRVRIYFRWIFIFLIADVLVLMLPTWFINLITFYQLFNNFLVVVLVAINLFPVFLVIKSIEGAATQAFENL